MPIRNYILFVCAFASTLAGFGQIEKSGVPFSWNFSVGETSAIWNDLPSLSVADLIGEDEADLVAKTRPFRFADTIQIDFDLNNSGRWTNLNNGDRIWRIGLRVSQGYSMSVAFDNFDLPQGANLYIYNRENTDFTGPYTRSNNISTGFLNSIPIPGNNLILEYYEPYAHRGHGFLHLNHVAVGYRDLGNTPTSIDDSCLHLINDDESRSLDESVNSMVMMLVDNGRRIATGTLINNTRGDGTTLLLTATSSLIGDPNSWIFVFGYNPGECVNSVACWTKALYGAEVLSTDEGSGLSLLRLYQHPRNTWNAYYAGWVGANDNSSQYVALQYGLGRSLNICYSSQSLIAEDWNNLSTVSISDWQNGNTYAGSIGSPLFNTNGKLEAVFVGGDITCDHQGSDHFARLQEAWGSFKYYLNPVGSNNFQAVSGLYPVYNEAGDSVDNGFLAFFPNPSNGILNIDNRTAAQIANIRIIDGMGRKVADWETPSAQISLEGLAAGTYMLQVSMDDGTTDYQRVVIY